METRAGVSDGELVRRAGNGDAESYVALASRYDTPLFSYAARMLGGLGDGERCLLAALAAGWRELRGGAPPARPQPQEWLYGLVREHAFDELAGRPPGTTGDDDLGSVEDCVEQAADAALRGLRPAYRDLLLLSDVHGLDPALLCAVTDMSEADVQNQLYRARAEFGGAFASLPAPERCQRPPRSTARTAPSASGCAASPCTPWCASGPSRCATACGRNCGRPFKRPSPAAAAPRPPCPASR